MAIRKKTLRDNGITLVSAKEHIPEGPEDSILESLIEGMAAYISVELAQMGQSWSTRDTYQKELLRRRYSIRLQGREQKVRDLR